MISKWKLTNFKSFRDATLLNFAPLTIFVGANSSGKSSVLQSILLISQTLSSRVSSRSVVLNGPLVRLGQFDDLKSYASKSTAIELEWECRSPQSDVGDIHCQLAFEPGPSSSQRELMQLQPQLSHCAISHTRMSIRDGEPREESELISLSRRRETAAPLHEGTALEEEVAQPTFSVDVSRAFLRELHEEIPSAILVDCLIHHFLPSRLVLQLDRTDQLARAAASAVLQYAWRLSSPSVRVPRSVLPRMPFGNVDLRRLEFPESVVTLLYNKLGTNAEAIFGRSSPLFEGPTDENPKFTMGQWQERLRRIESTRRMELQTALQDSFAELVDAFRGTQGEDIQAVSHEIPESITEAVEYLDEYFTNSVKYLGPLRDEPKALYPLAATIDPFDIGLRGEYTAAVLDLHRFRTIEYYHPKAIEGLHEPPDQATLEHAVLDWLKYLGVAEGISTRDMGKIGHELKVVTKLARKQNDLTHVGVGVSQILPILVMCLLADKDTTLILEQPELHLHPRVQTLLADFFLSMARLGKQCLLETHSEYIVNRLRLRAALSNNRDFLDLMKLYFVEPQQGTSSIREVVINEYGAILDWPAGFFDESQREAEDILKAATVKRKSVKGTT